MFDIFIRIILFYFFMQNVGFQPLGFETPLVQPRMKPKICPTSRHYDFDNPIISNQSKLMKSTKNRSTSIQDSMERLNGNIMLSKRVDQSLARIVTDIYDSSKGSADHLISPMIGSNKINIFSDNALDKSVKLGGRAINLGGLQDENKISKEDLISVLSSPVEKLRKTIRGEFSTKKAYEKWQSSSQTRIKILNNDGKQLRGQSEFLTSSRIESTMDSTQPGVSSIQRKNWLKNTTYTQRRDFLKNQMTYFNQYLSPAQKRNILVTQRNIKSQLSDKKQPIFAQMSRVEQKKQCYFPPVVDDYCSEVWPPVPISNEESVEIINETFRKLNITPSQRAPSQLSPIGSRKGSSSRQPMMFLQTSGDKDSPIKRSASPELTASSLQVQIKGIVLPTKRVSIPSPLKRGPTFENSSPKREGSIRTMKTFSSKKSGTFIDRPKLAYKATMGYIQQGSPNSPTRSPLLRLSENSREESEVSEEKDPLTSFQEDHEASKGKYLFTKEGILEMLDQLIENQRDEKMMEEGQYRNVLVQDKEALMKISGKLAIMYKRSVQKMPKMLRHHAQQEFNLKEVNNHYLVTEKCGVRDLIKKRLFPDDCNHGPECDHQIDQKAEFEIQLLKELQKYKTKLHDKMREKFPKKEKYDQDPKNLKLITELEKIQQLVKQNSTCNRRNAISLDRSKSSSKDEVDDQIVNDIHDNIFHRLCLHNKSKIEVKPQVHTEIGNSNDGTINFGHNTQILTSNSVDFPQKCSNFKFIQDQYDQTYHQFEKTLREYNVQIQAQKTEKQNQKQKKSQNRPLSPKAEKSAQDVVLKAFKRNLANQIHSDQVYELDHKDSNKFAAQKEKNYLSKTQYFQEVKKGLMNPEGVPTISMKYYTDLVNQQYNGESTHDQDKNHPQIRFFRQTLGQVSQGSLCINLPRFQHIKNGILSLVNQNMIFPECTALKKYLINSVAKTQDLITRQNCMINTILIDDLKFSDKMFAEILEGINKQGSQSDDFPIFTPPIRILEEIIYMNGELGPLSCEILCEFIFQNQQNLRSITFSNLKNQSANQDALNQILDSLDVGTVKLRKLKITKMKIYETKMFASIKEIIKLKLQEIDLSWTALKYTQLSELSQAILTSNHLKSINLSYLNLTDISNLQRKELHSKRFIEDLVLFIKSSVTLMHLNLNGMGISSTHMITLVTEGISQSKTLVGVHLTANNIKEGSKLRDDICQILGIQQLYKGQTLDKEFNSENIAPKMSELVENNELNRDILAIFKQDEALHRASGDPQPVQNLDQQFVIQRYLGHSELMVEENWQINKHEKCYFCEKAKYVQIYYDRQDKQYEQINDPKIIAKLQKQLKIQQNAEGPQLFSSMFENFIPVPLIDVKILSGFLLQNQVLETSRENRNIKMLKKNLKSEILNPSPELYEHFQKTMINWRSILTQRIKYSGQYDCIRIGFPPKVSESKTYIHCTFASPGIHTIIIYDERKFYKKSQMIKYKCDEPNPYIAKDEAQGEALSPTTPAYANYRAQRDLFSVKLGLPETQQLKSKNITMNFKQTDFSHEILAEEFKGLDIKKFDSQKCHAILSKNYWLLMSIYQFDNMGSKTRIQFVNQNILQKSDKLEQIETQIQTLRSQFSEGQLKMIEFRKKTMSIKKEKMHRFLTDNLSLIYLVLEIYTPENYHVLTKDSFRLDLVNLLQDLDNLDELPILLPALEGVGLTYQKLLDLCKQEKSFAFSQLDWYRKDPQIPKIEFIELICRVAQLMKMSVIDFVKDKLMQLITYQHNQIWSKKGGEEETFLHQLLPKKYEFPTLAESETPVPVSKLVSRRSSLEHQQPITHYEWYKVNVMFANQSIQAQLQGHSECEESEID